MRSSVNFWVVEFFSRRTKIHSSLKSLKVAILSGPTTGKNQTRATVNQAMAVERQSHFNS